jgi:hypothetical protein
MRQREALLSEKEYIVKKGLKPRTIWKWFLLTLEPVLKHPMDSTG